MEEIESFLFVKWSVQVQRRAFRRTVSIYLYPDKPIRVVAGKTTSQKVIVDFLMTKKNWIEKSFEKFEEMAARFPKKQFRASEDFPFMGRDLKLKVVITPHKKPFVSTTEENLLLHIPRNDWSADTPAQEHPGALKEIREFYKREAQKVLTARALHWAREMNLHPSQLKFREQRTRWGSCSSNKVINLNWRLIVFPLEIIDYVIIHELAHLRHMDHSARFWSLVEQFQPDYREHMKVLKDCQHQVEFLSVAS